MKLNPEALRVTSFETSQDSLGSKYPPTHPTDLTNCFVCPEEPFTHDHQQQQ